MKHCFISGCGTDIGKTFVSSVIITHLRRAGSKIAACKPMMSGVENWDNNDCAELLRAMKIEVDEQNIRAISPWIFAEPLSPHRAAELNRVSINFAELVYWCASWLDARQNHNAIIEGVGGVYVPINYQHTTLDLMRELSLPVIVVCGDYLGTISHSLSALECLKMHGIEIAAIIINQSENGKDHEGSKRTIAHFSGERVISLKRADESAKIMWQHEDDWRLSKIWQNNPEFFNFIEAYFAI